MSANIQDNPMHQFDAATAFARYQIMLWAEGRQRFLSQVADLTKAWSDEVRRGSDAEAAYARRLIDSNTPEQAMEIYLEWASSLASAFASESQRLGNSWVNFASGCPREDT